MYCVVLYTIYCICHIYDNLYKFWYQWNIFDIKHQLDKICTPEFRFIIELPLLWSFIIELPLLLKYTIEACVHPSGFFLGNMSAQVHVYICVYISFKHKIHEELSLTFRENGRKLIKLQMYRNALIYTKLSILLHIVCVAVLYCRTSLKCF